jgi:hypothetical protein
MLPYYPLEEDKGHKYHIETYDEHLVSQYVGISIIEVGELDYLDYLLYRRDAFIKMMSQTEKGQEYLDNAYRLEQVAPDRNALREKFGKEG